MCIELWAAYNSEWVNLCYVYIVVMSFIVYSLLFFSCVFFLLYTYVISLIALGVTFYYCVFCCRIYINCTYVGIFVFFIMFACLSFCLSFLVMYLLVFLFVFIMFVFNGHLWRRIFFWLRSGLYNQCGWEGEIGL